jgi:hypothetical protein
LTPTAEPTGRKVAALVLPANRAMTTMAAPPGFVGDGVDTQVDVHVLRA